MKRPALLSLLSALMISAGTPAGMIIENTATYEDDLITIPSNTVRITVNPVCAADLTPEQTARNAQPGETVTTPFILTNTGNSVQRYPLTLSANDLNAQVTPDLNGNGLPDDGAATSVTLEPDARVTLLVSATPTTSGTHRVTLSSGCEGALNAVLTLNSRHVAPQVTKTVIGNTTAEEGQTVQYRITVTNPERVAMPGVVIEDEMNTALEFVEVSPNENVSVTTLPSGKTLLRWQTDLAAGETRTYTLTTRIRPGVNDDTEISNTITASNDSGSATSTPPAVIRIFTSRILVSKAAEPLIIDPGGLVTYTVTVFNPSTTAISDTVMIDTPDPVLTILTDTVTLDGQPVTATTQGDTLRVNIGALPSNQGVTIRYRARLPLEAPTRPIVNSAVASARGRQGTIIANVISNVAAANIISRQKLSASGNDLIGRVYVDRNRNQRFDQNADTPLQNARVLLAGGREVTTDSNGLYAFANVPAGMHAVRLDPQSVPYTPEARSDSLHGAFRAFSAAPQVAGLTVQDFPLTPNVARVTTPTGWSNANVTVTFADGAATATNNRDLNTCVLIGDVRLNLAPKQSARTPVLPSRPTPQEIDCR